MQGAAGPRGPAGEVELITCNTVTKTVKGRKRQHKHCTTESVSGPVSFATSAAVHVTLSRRHHVYATGAARLLDGRPQQFVLRALRALTPGGYTLVLRRHEGGRWVTTRQRVMIG